MNKEVSEEDILRIFVEEMHKLGVSRKFLRLDVDDAMVEKINSIKKANINLEQLFKLADRCLANEWLEYTVMGAGKYGHLSLTTSGFGVVAFRQRQDEALAKRPWLKKASDYIEDHKGIFLALGAAIAVAGLFLKLFMG
jgi:hypothetical protein